MKIGGLNGKYLKWESKYIFIVLEKVILRIDLVLSNSTKPK